MAITDGMEISETVWSESDEVLNDGDLRAVFDKLDVNSDNSLDYYEVSAIIRRGLINKRSKAHRKRSPRPRNALSLERTGARIR